MPVFPLMFAQKCQSRVLITSFVWGGFGLKGKLKICPTSLTSLTYAWYGLVLEEPNNSRCFWGVHSWWWLRCCGSHTESPLIIYPRSSVNRVNPTHIAALMHANTTLSRKSHLIPHSILTLLCPLGSRHHLRHKSCTLVAVLLKETRMHYKLQYEII